MAELLVGRAFHLYWRWARAMTLGVRGLVVDADRKIFLVKHTYVSGWQFPGVAWNLEKRLSRLWLAS